MDYPDPHSDDYAPQQEPDPGISKTNILRFAVVCAFYAFVLAVLCSILTLDTEL